MKIAIITSGTPRDKKGAFNATHQRIKHLKHQKIETDVFIIRYYENRFIQMLRRKQYRKEVKEDFFIYDEVKYHNLWVPFALSDYLQWQKFNQLGSVFIRFAKSWAKLFEKYDLISAHSLEPAIVAMFAKEKLGTPFSVTWHGSEIHSMPKTNSAVKRMVLKICNAASIQFFVSKQLQVDAANLGANIQNSDVLYNAVDRDQFKPYPGDKKKALKDLNKINDSSYNVAFIGGLVPVKKVLILPTIFRKISDALGDVNFYFIGDGNLKSALMELCNQLSLNVVFMGNRPPDEMPDMINCFDLVVLPSENEGLPLIVLECMACQTPIISSRVGGIPEVLGNEYTIPHGPGFAEEFADRAIEVLKNPGENILKLSSLFNWELTAEKEAKSYREILVAQGEI